MEWTEEHDVLFLREMVASDIFIHKKGSVDRGKIWEDVFERLNHNENPKFYIKDKRGVRDRWSLLQSKFKKRIRKEEAASGIETDDMTEKDVLIEDLCEKEESSIAIITNKKSNDRETAEEVRRQAMERMGSTSKRKSEARGDTAEIKQRRTGGDVVSYLREKAKSEQALHQEEIEIKRKDQEKAMKQQDAMLELMKQQADRMQESQKQMLQQQQLMSEALVSVMQRLINK